MVQLTLNGKGDVKKVKIDKAVVDPAGSRGAGGPARRRVQRRTAEGQRPYRGRDAEADRRPGAARRDETAVLSRLGSLAAPATRAGAHTRGCIAAGVSRHSGNCRRRKPPMEMQGERRIPAPRQMVWERLNDPETLKQCIPGCESDREGLRHRIHRQGRRQGRAGQGELFRQGHAVRPRSARRLHDQRRGHRRGRRLRQGRRQGRARGGGRRDRAALRACRRRSAASWRRSARA